MELKDLVLKHYRVEQVLDGLYPTRMRIVAIEDTNGLYKADSAEKIERAMNTGCSISKMDNIFVRSSLKSSKWRPISRR